MKSNKLDYIVQNFSDANYNFIYPILSTLLLILVFPFFSNGAYWISMKFLKWRLDQKDNINKSQRLTVEQSLQLKVKLKNTLFEYNNILAERETEIENLKTQIAFLTKNDQPTDDSAKSSTIENLYEKIKFTEEIKDAFGSIISKSDSEGRIENSDFNSLTEDMKTNLVSSNIIKHQEYGKGYILTSVGLELKKIYLDDKYNSSKSYLAAEISKSKYDKVRLKALKLFEKEFAHEVKINDLDFELGTLNSDAFATNGDTGPSAIDYAIHFIYNKGSKLSEKNKAIIQNIEREFMHDRRQIQTHRNKVLLYIVANAEGNSDEIKNEVESLFYTYTGVANMEIRVYNTESLI